MMEERDFVTKVRVTLRRMGFRVIPGYISAPDRGFLCAAEDYAAFYLPPAGSPEATLRWIAQGVVELYVGLPRASAGPVRVAQVEAGDSTAVATLSRYFLPYTERTLARAEGSLTCS